MRGNVTKYRFSNAAGRPCGAEKNCESSRCRRLNNRDDRDAAMRFCFPEIAINNGF